MNRFSDFADQYAAESSTSYEFDEKIFQQFMVKNPIWEYTQFQMLSTCIKIRRKKNNLFIIIIRK